MAHSFHHSSGSLPITLTLDETEVTRPCPTCKRLEFEDGSITLFVSVERTSGMQPARCERGHVVMVQWTRVAADGENGK